MRLFLAFSMFWLTLSACLPSDVCDPGQVQVGDVGNLCVPQPDGGLPQDAGSDGGELDGG